MPPASQVVRVVARALQALVLVLGVGSLTVQFTGCTAIGYGLGRFVDSRQKTRYRPADPARRFRIESGTEVRLRLRDSTIVQGVYTGVVSRPSGAYAVAYEAWRAGQPEATPRLGERVSIDRTHGRTRSAVFAGFDDTGIRLDDPNPNRTPLVKWQDIRAARTGRGELPVAAWQASVRDGTLPLSVQLAIRQRGGAMRSVDAYDVAQLEVGVPKHGVVVGTVLGVAADATVIVGITAFASWSTGSTGQDCGGPYGGSLWY